MSRVHWGFLYLEHVEAAGSGMSVISHWMSSI